MKDQYGNDVPDDLVILPNPCDLLNEDIWKVIEARWYEQNGILMGSAKEIDYISEDDPVDAGITLKDGEVMYIASSLHRWSEEDGFYHA